MIAVDTIYPADMPPSIDDDRYNHEKLQSYHNGMLSEKHASRDLGRGAIHSQHQPVVDLSVPVHHQSQMSNEHNAGLALSAPRQGQDIFDTWCASALPSPPFLHLPVRRLSCRVSVRLRQHRPQSFSRCLKGHLFVAQATHGTGLRKRRRD